MIAPAEISSPSETGRQRQVTVNGEQASPRRPAIRLRLLMVAATALLGATGIAALVVGHPFMQWDATVERAIQGTNWGPLALSFPVFSWIGDIKGAILDAAVFVLILVLNRPAWRLALMGAATGLLYAGIAHVVLRPRPTVAQVLWVTEHPSASSFPSGHTIFIATICTLVMLCLGHRYLPRWALPIGWAIVAVIVFLGGISRIYVGAHWPTDVLAGLLIATTWLAFTVSVRSISDRAFRR